MTFKYKNDIAADIKSNDLIEVRCMMCGCVKRISYKNYLKCFNRKRLINDIIHTDIYVCRRCSKELQDTNLSIITKNSQAQKNLSPEIKRKKTEWAKDKTRRTDAIKKGVATMKKKYGDDYYLNLLKKVDRNKQIATCAKTVALRHAMENEQVKILIDDIKLGNLNSLDKKNSLHKKVIRHFFGITRYIHPVLFEIAPSVIKNEKPSYSILKLTSMSRKSNGEVKRGWVQIKNKILRFDSIAELTFILWKIDLFIDEIFLRNYDSFAYIINGSSKKYYPDFYDSHGNYYEIKYRREYEINTQMINIKQHTCNAELVFYEDMPQTCKQLARLLIKQYENGK